MSTDHPNQSQSIRKPAVASQRAAEDQAVLAAEKLATFVPECLHGEDRAVVDAVMPVVREYVAAVKPAGPQQVRRFVRTMAKYLLNAVNNYESLDPESVLHPDAIDHFIVQVSKDNSDRSRHSTRWVLEKIGQAVAPHLWPTPRTRLGKHRVAAPYSATIEEAFRIAGVARCERGWPEDAAVVFGTLGMGLSGTEIANLSPNNVVSIAEGRLAVHVTGLHPRLVPIRAAYTDLAWSAIEAIAERTFVLSSSNRNAVHQVTARIVVKGHGKLVVARARSTWLKAHLTAGTPLPTIRKLAGPLAMNTLTDLVNYTAEELTSEEAALEGLRA